jgi:hypothetical protein
MTTASWSESLEFYAIFISDKPLVFADRRQRSILVRHRRPSSPLKHKRSCDSPDSPARQSQSPIPRVLQRTAARRRGHSKSPVGKLKRQSRPPLDVARRNEEECSAERDDFGMGNRGRLVARRTSLRQRGMGQSRDDPLEY